MRAVLASVATLALLAPLTSSPLLVPSWARADTGADGERDWTDAMAREHADDRPVASPAAADGAGGAGLDEREVTYHHRDGRAVRGFLARPGSGAAAPGVLVIHEWWGLNDNVRAMTRRLAREGYAALAVDLYAGGVADDPAAARALMQSAMRDPAALRENLRAAHAWLDGQGAPRTGVLGWCFGGGWALEAALALGAELDAAVMYYGRVVTERDRLAALRTPLLGLFAGEDRGIPVETVRRFESLLAELGKPAAIHVYPGADHAFANPSGTRYDAAAAEDAWRRTLAFLAEHLRPGS